MARRDFQASADITMSFKQAVIETLTKNRDEHSRIYKQAVEGYRTALRDAVTDMRRLLDVKIDEMETQETPSPHLSSNPLAKLSVPKSHLDQYDTVIEMLRLTTDDTIMLNQDQYNCYMKDEWFWTKDFLVGNSQYSSLASLKLR